MLRFSIGVGALVCGCWLSLAAQCAGRFFSASDIRKHRSARSCIERFDRSEQVQLKSLRLGINGPKVRSG